MNEYTASSSINADELSKFKKLAEQWWNPHGSLKTLHDINPCRLKCIQSKIELKGIRVLDVGCGGGILSESMAQLGAEVTGLDAEMTLIDIAQQHAIQQSLSINYQCAAIENFQAPPFDAITCMEMLEHVDNPALVIEHCFRLLQPGGYLFLSTINRTLTAYLSAIVGAEYLLRLLPQQTHDYQRFIKPSELAKMTRAAGLEVVSVQGMSYNPFTRIAKQSHFTAINYVLTCMKPNR